MLRKGTVAYQKATLVAEELELLGECPDVFGWSSNCTQLIEVKVSRADFLADKKKHWRKNPSFGMGMYRSYLCPKGLINPDELPENWGLFYVTDFFAIIKVVEPKKFTNYQAMSDIAALMSILRREGIYKKIIRYKKEK